MAILTKICAYFVAFLIWLIGGFDTLAKVLIGLMLIDYASGVYVGYKLKNLNSKRAYKGIEKKLWILALLCGASLMHKLVPSIGFRSLVGIFYCATELLSIVENAAKAGVPIPKKLKKALEQLKEEDKEEEIKKSSH